MLTDTQCRTAKPKDKPKPYKLPDGKPNGVKAWRGNGEKRFLA